jgi:16S rRNA (cytosine(1402)-N(4))-methyltransferase
MAEHISVLLRESIDSLNIKPDGIYVDGTLGLGGHSLEIAKRLTTGRLVGIDRDETAIARAGERLREFSERVTLVHGNFCNIPEILDELGIGKADGMLFDLGVSSPQLDETDRGFSYMTDAPLDMRMDRDNTLSAWLVVNRWPEDKLERILRDYGEERYARRIAAAIVRCREEKEISSTLELVDIIKGAMPGPALREKQHPAKAFVSGDTHRCERRTGRCGRDDAYGAGQAERGRQTGGNKLPLAGGQDSQDSDSVQRKRMHLPQRGSGVHLRVCEDAEKRDKETHSTVR